MARQQIDMLPGEGGQWGWGQLFYRLSSNSCLGMLYCYELSWGLIFALWQCCKVGMNYKHQHFHDIIHNKLVYFFILNTIYLYNHLTCKSTNIGVQPNYIRIDNKRPPGSCFLPSFPYGNSCSNHINKQKLLAKLMSSLVGINNRSSFAPPLPLRSSAGPAYLYLNLSVNNHKNTLIIMECNWLVIKTSNWNLKKNKKWVAALGLPWWSPRQWGQ